MNVRNVFRVLTAFGLALAASSSAWAGQFGTEFGQPGDGYIDLYIDLWPGWDSRPPVPQPPEDTGAPGSWIDTDGTRINGFVIQSDECVFDGPEDAILTGLFQTDNDCMISDGFIVPPLDGTRYLGDVFRTSLLPALTGPDFWWPVQFLNDLTFTYTIQDRPGTYYGDIIVTHLCCQPCYAPELDELPVQLVQPGELAEFLVTAFDLDLPNDVLTFSLDPTLPELVNPWPDGVTIDATTGQLSWQVQGRPGELFDVGIVVTDSCEIMAPLSDTGVLTFRVGVIPEPGTLAMLAAGALVGWALLRRRGPVAESS